MAVKTHLSLGDKDGHGVVLASRRKGEISGPFDPQLVPDGDEVVALVELDLIRDQPSTVLLVGRVLEVPAALLLLNKASNGLLVSSGDAVLDCPPDLEVLGGVAGLILGWPLPGNDKGT